MSACVRLRGKGGKLGQEIRTFGTISEELLALHDWLSAHRVTHVAMEATGVYGKPVYYMLEDAFSVVLVNPAEIKRRPGRKTDVSDCAWLAQLLENGMLQPSFIPPREIRELRDLVRYRTRLKHDHTRFANRLHKVLQDADLQLSSVMSEFSASRADRSCASWRRVIATPQAWPSWRAAACGASCRRCVRR